VTVKGIIANSEARLDEHENGLLAGRMRLESHAAAHGPRRRISPTFADPLLGASGFDRIDVAKRAPNIHHHRLAAGREPHPEMAALKERHTEFILNQCDRGPDV
jgi:hypothetical protein